MSDDPDFYRRMYIAAQNELRAANERIKRLEDSVQTAWGIISNVSGGNWHNQSPEWRDAATRWCCNDFLPSIPEAEEAP